MLLSALSMIKTSFLTLLGTGISRALLFCVKIGILWVWSIRWILCINQCNHVMAMTMEVAVFFRNNKLWSVLMLRK